MKQDGCSILADFEGEETQVANIAPPSRSHPDYGYNARVRAWAAEYMRLFLAAPDLLAALETLLPYVESGWETTRDDYGGATDAVNAARAAIAKAKVANDDD